MLSDYLARLERNLMTGSARWVADFTESFRGFPLGGHRFALFLRGQTRPKGIFLSRLFAYFSLPNYLPVCLVHAGAITTRQLRNLIRAAEKYLDEEGYHWAWLVCVSEKPPEDQVRRFVEDFSSKMVGVGLVDLSSRTVVASASHVGRKLRDHVRCWA